MTTPSLLPLVDANRRDAMLERDPERALLERAQRGDRASRDHLVTSHLRLVASIARRNVRRGTSIEDAVNEGVLGLLEAIDRFDVTRDNRFSTYAAYWVLDRVRRHANGARAMVSAPSSRRARTVMRGYGRASRQLERTNGRRPSREEIANHLGVDESDVALCEPSLFGSDVAMDSFEPSDSRAHVLETRADPEEAVADAEEAFVRHERVAAALEALAPRERWIIERRFLADDASSLTELGATLGVSRERARQIQETARAKLRRALAS
jgi:RNA polymerase sigma-32 factor